MDNQLHKSDAREFAGTRWKQYGCLQRTSIPPGLYGWLLDTASLTARLQHLCPGRFSVELLSQGRSRPRRDEARVLGMRNGERALVRQVRLLCGDQPWIFARTVIPVTSLRGRLQRLAHLGTRPLGAMLFADPAMRRGNVELARITPGQPLFSEAVRDSRQRPEEIWGRRSVFRIAALPLLVSEIFLPGFPAADADRPFRKSR